MVNKVWEVPRSQIIISGILMVIGLIDSAIYFNVDDKDITFRIIAFIGVFLFVVFGTIFLHLLTSVLYNIMAHHQLGIGRSAAIQFSLRIIGYLVILLSALELMDISIAKLLLGGAILGIILGVAAQQSLGNFFASIILILTHPYRVGEEVTIISGSFGGTHEGTVMDIGLTHTKLQLKGKGGEIIFLPNSTLLSWAAIIPHKK